MLLPVQIILSFSVPPIEVSHHDSQAEKNKFTAQWDLTGWHKGPIFMTTVPKNLYRNVQESTFDGHKDDDRYNLYFSSAGIFAVDFLCHMSEVCRSCMSLPTLLPVHDVIAGTVT